MVFSRWFSSKKTHSLAPQAHHERVREQSLSEASPQDRYERRDALFGVVRESMLKAGALSSQYKFKVLTLNGAGTSFMVMVTLPPLPPEELRFMSDVEMDITRLAKLKHGILVNGVYWRTSELITRPRANIAPVFTAANAPRSSGSMLAHLTQGMEISRPSHRVDAVDESEIAAFKRAMAHSTRHLSGLSDCGQILPTRRPHPLAVSDFQDTEQTACQNDLSATQYAGL